MGLFKHQNKSNNKAQTKTNVKPTDTLDTTDYQGPNILGVFNQPSIFIYGHPINVKLSSDHDTDVQINLFVKRPALLGTIYQSDLLTNTVNDGLLPIKMLITTDNVSLAKTLLERLTNTKNLMIAATGTASTYLTKNGIRRAEMIVPFGSFMIINANGSGQTEVTTVTTDDNVTDTAKAVNNTDTLNFDQSKETTFQKPITNNQASPVANEANSKPIAGAENIDIDNSNSLDDFDTDSNFDQELKDL